MSANMINGIRRARGKKQLALLTPTTSLTSVLSHSDSVEDCVDVEIGHLVALTNIMIALGPGKYAATLVAHYTPTDHDPNQNSGASVPPAATK